MSASERFIEETPLKGVRENRMFLVKNIDTNEIMCDDNGAYRNSKSVIKPYHVSKVTGDSFKVKTVHNEDGGFFIKERVSRTYIKKYVPANQVFYMERKYREKVSKACVIL